MCVCLTASSKTMDHIHEQCPTHQATEPRHNCAGIDLAAGHKIYSLDRFSCCQVPLSPFVYSLTFSHSFFFLSAFVLFFIHIISNPAINYCRL